MLNHSVNSSSPRRWLNPLLLALVLIGLNMRPLLTSIGPLLPTLRQATGLSFGGAALLTTLPVLMMGLMALAGGAINRLFNERSAVALSLLAIGLGALWRELAPGSVQLLMSAVLGGLGIGVIQAVMPGIIKHHFLKSMALVAGLWSAALMGGGGLGAAITPWLMSTGHDWHSALAWWALPALVAGQPRAVSPGRGGRTPRARPAAQPARLAARRLFRPDQRRLYQPDRLAAAVLHAARLAAAGQRFAAGADDLRPGIGRAAAAGAGAQS